MLAFTLIFTSLFIARYAVAGYEHELDLRDATPAGTQGATA
jgi:hypothetical protein